VEKPFGHREEGGRLKALERPLRLAALLGLCALVWWFSYDHGRESARTRVARIEAENISLREKVILLEEDVKRLNADLRGARGQRGADAEGPGEAGADGSLEENAGVPSEVSSDAQGRREAGADGSLETSADARGSDSRVEAAPRGASADPASPAVLAPRPPAPPAIGGTPAAPDRGRLTLKLSENKGLFGGRVILTMVELDSLDQEALVRAHFRDTGKRLAQLMVPGDILELDLDGEPHRLYLDQIRGTLAFLIVDGTPGGD
jgi:hypothetical protein